MADDKKKKSVNMAHAASTMFCMDPEISQLTPEQLNGLHIFKHKMLAAAFELYNVVPQAQADKILSRVFRELPDQIDPRP